MLVLTRRAGEHITIGDDTVVHVQTVVGNRVRLAIEAPHSTKILRGELSPFDVNGLAEKLPRQPIEAHHIAAGAIDD